MHRLGLIAVLIFGTASCYVRRSSTDRSMVAEALTAQLGGFGGCGEISSIERRPANFFPGVALYYGRCIAEHGDSAQGVVAMDRDGVLYQLGATAPFAFLLRRHAPTGLSRTSAVDYAEQAVIFAGFVPAHARFVNDTGTAPTFAVSIAKQSGTKLLPAGLREERPTLWVTQLSAYTPTTLTNLIVGVVKADGDLIVLERRQYRLESDR